MFEQLPPHFRVIAQAFSDWWDDWFNMFLVSIVWMVAWATVILGPPATFGLYHVANQLHHRDRLGLGGLIQGGKQYFLKSWLWAFMNLFVAILLAANFLFYGQLSPPWGGFLQGIFIVLGINWLVVQFYALPYLMEQEKKQLRLALRNGLLTFLASPGYTTVVMIFVVVLSVASVLIVLPLFLGAPGLIAALGTRAILERMETFGVRERETPPEDD